MEAAQKAADAKVPVYTVALGTDAGTVDFPDGFGGTQTVRVPPDPETLRAVAQRTDGKFFQAADSEALRSVYSEIGSQVGVDHEHRELTVAFTAAGAVLLLVGAALSTLWFARIP
jgi:Ca-activated chloride channel family protein